MDYSPWSEAEKWQIRAPTKFWIETHHLKGIFLSFQNIIKILTLDQLYSSYGCWKTLFITDLGNLSAAITSILWDRKSKCLWFSESLETDLSNGTIKVHIREIKLFVNLAVPWSEAEKWQIRARRKFWIETHHLKGIFLSFQNIIKILTLDQLYSSYGCWKTPFN